ncbi:hypothetical protein ACTI_54430 [Actinoplanes sp. OR16]|uniref:hypothetical protein n=1 Tax=Actinoplanes sp. OR16 TaxID=946334 RepID=UPI000F6DE077|nr:hypothetical protein [Actinoplanes sp. OR16]BBH68758.1 hypothetical protein ACTI_54430 [Actinoplanes sp. OR16]
MSTRIAVLFAAPFAMLAFVLRVGEKLWLEPFTWNTPSALLGLLAFLGLVGGSAAVPVGGYWLLTQSARRRPKTWHLAAGKRRFTAPVSPYGPGPWAIVAGWLAGGTVPIERVPNQDHMRIAQLGVRTSILIVTAAAIMIIALLCLVLLAAPSAPILSLDSEGMTLRGLWRQTRLRWHELVPGGPPRPSTNNPAVLVLYQQKAGPAAGPPRRRRLDARRLHVDTTFLADTIRCYVDNPHRRAGIGTAEELTALQPSSEQGPPSAYHR